MNRHRIPSLAVFLIIVLVAALPACSKNSTKPNTDGTPTGPTFDSGSFNSSTFVFTFTTEGSFGYRCTLHPGMNGTVVVSTTGVDSPLVTIRSAPNVFDPATVNVKTNSYVRWVNSGTMNHTVTRP